ncbi:hypothetical protein ACD591_04920 [Rufibacter glacialis]|uniref:Uncharacterized protein n=1 Tax=Rufibacter glacialis TaxID=1259555 RepID=A0A5M8QIA0_9BACT|nr:hypothetical protein [Rufibacter glacialis]KAA6434694.1 hypothetical protein FOE74_10975 [Rufibacter glacialis]GGK71673.1 hypothetical protein GCM10011405_19840 [Rufibacter glacialis]
METYFDFHFHPLAKRFLVQFNDLERQNKLCTEPIPLPPIGGVVDKLSGSILQSQGCVSQAVSGRILLGVANIVAIEYVFATKKGMLKLLELEVFGQDVVAPLDNRLFDFIRNGAGSYNTLFSKELAFYQWVAQQTNLRFHINLLTRKKKGGLELQEGKLNLALAIEGGHNLSKRFINQLAGEADPAAVVTGYRQNPLVDFLYLTLTHLSHVPEQLLCTHAFGFKMVKDIAEARPQIKGLTLLGKKVVRACVDTQQTANPILIDIKHMSLQGRHDFYAYRRLLLETKPDGFKAPKEVSGKAWWPILATHMGVTGFRSGELRDYIKEYGVERGNEFSVRVQLGREKAAKLPEGIGLDNVFFNPASISLFDDDIEEIARSRGLIGISLDARILGFEGILGRKQPDYDYFSREDFAQLFPDLAQRLPRLAPVEEPPTGPAAQEVALPATKESLIPGLADRGKRELYLFCLNLLHVVAVINKMPALERHGKDGWDFLCIGSDFDGLIDSLKTANTAQSLPQFEKVLQAYLPKAEKAYLKTHEGKTSLIRREGEHLLTNQVLRQVFYTNGEQFLKEWWG